MHAGTAPDSRAHHTSAAQSDSSSNSLEAVRDEVRAFVLSLSGDAAGALAHYLLRTLARGKCWHRRQKKSA